MLGAMNSHAARVWGETRQRRRVAGAARAAPATVAVGEVIAGPSPACVAGERLETSLLLVENRLHLLGGRGEQLLGACLHR